jgi:hypothetical protein
LQYYPNIHEELLHCSVEDISAAVQASGWFSARKNDLSSERAAGLMRTQAKKKEMQNQPS